jgi:hypothetical protein
MAVEIDMHETMPPLCSTWLDASVGSIRGSSAERRRPVESAKIKRKRYGRKRRMPLPIGHFRTKLRFRAQFCRGGKTRGKCSIYSISDSKRTLVLFPSVAIPPARAHAVHPRHRKAQLNHRLNKVLVRLDSCKYHRYNL